MGLSHYGIERATADIGVILKFVRIAKKCSNG
jgi:hypothetical protein